MNHVLKLDRPLAVLDLETTGTAPEIDRIIEIAILLVYPDGKEIEYCRRVNPEIAIPPEATNVHGIRDEDVKDKLPFRAIALEVAAVLKDCDVAGFNVAAFDLRLLANEFNRAGVEFSTEGRSIIDAQRIFHVKEPRDLLSWFSVKWRVAVFGKLPYSAAARREFSRHRGLSFDAVLA